MEIGDRINIGIFVGLGLWWALFPSSVVSFYMWLSRQRERYHKRPRTGIIRLAGALWIAIVFLLVALR
jgi:hypothetical protein